MMEAPERNRIYVADALTFLGGMPNECIDMILTSPPYDNLRAYNGYTLDFEAIARESYRVLKQGGVLVWIVGDATIDGSETLTSFRQALCFVDTVGFRMHDTMIYHKDMSFPETNRYSPCFEYMFVLSKGAPKTFNALMKPNKYAGGKISKTQRRKDGTIEIGIGQREGRYFKDEGALANVWYLSSGYMKTTADKFAYAHPAMFPEELAERHIRTWSNEGDLVLDYFMGSGTTAKMARNLKRHYIGCDISEDYVLIARDRLRMPFEAKVTPQNDDVSDLPLFKKAEKS